MPEILGAEIEIQHVDDLAALAHGAGKRNCARSNTAQFGLVTGDFRKVTAAQSGRGYTSEEYSAGCPREGVKPMQRPDRRDNWPGIQRQIRGTGRRSRPRIVP